MICYAVLLKVYLHFNGLLHTFSCLMKKWDKIYILPYPIYAVYISFKETIAL